MAQQSLDIAQIGALFQQNHQALGYLTPESVYLNLNQQIPLAA